MSLDISSKRVGRGPIVSTRSPARKTNTAKAHASGTRSRPESSSLSRRTTRTNPEMPKNFAAESTQLPPQRVATRRDTSMPRQEERLEPSFDNFVDDSENRSNYPTRPIQNTNAREGVYSDEHGRESMDFPQQDGSVVTLFTGALVRVRNDPSETWSWGTITSMRPILVRTRVGNSNVMSEFTYIQLVKTTGPKNCSEMVCCCFF